MRFMRTIRKQKNGLGLNMKEINIKVRKKGRKETSVHADKKRRAKNGYNKHKEVL